MSTDYIVASLQPLAFDAPPPYTAEQFAAIAWNVELPAAWRDLEGQMRNAIAEERARMNSVRGTGETDASKWKRPTEGCMLYWTNRARAACAERDPIKRDSAIDRVFWDAAGELTPPASPLSRGALQTYAIRLGIALKRASRSTEAGNAVLDKLLTVTTDNQQPITL